MVLILQGQDGNFACLCHGKQRFHCISGLGLKQKKKNNFSEYFFGPTFELGNIQCNKVKNIFGRFFF